MGRHLPKGNFLYHEPCEACGSSDGKAVYDNNTATCFSCKTYFKDNEAMETTEDTQDTKAFKFIQGSSQDISNRRLKEEICTKFHYQIGEDNGEPCHIANYHDPKTGRVIAQKIRKAGKKFKIIGQGKGLPFFGQHLYNGGKRLTITEGEIDALSVAQAMGMGKWPVVSLPNGAQSAVDTIEAQYEWLDTFEEIVLCFDQDQPGQEALEKALPALPAGKAFIMSLPCKDANERFCLTGSRFVVVPPVEDTDLDIVCVYDVDLSRALQASGFEISPHAEYENHNLSACFRKGLVNIIACQPDGTFEKWEKASALALMMNLQEKHQRVTLFQFITEGFVRNTTITY